jgi:hypothetical protein
MRTAAALTVLGVLGGLAAPARAGDPDEPPSEAVALFNHGRELVRAGNHREACPLFEQSLRLAPAIGTELNLALCYAATGRLIVARAMLEQLAKKTAAPGQEQRAAIVQKGLDDVVARTPKVTIDLGPLPADTEVHVDGKPVDVGSAIALDPGTHRVDAAGAKPTTFDVDDGAITTVTLERAPPPRPREPIELELGAAAGGLLLLGTITGVTVIRQRDAALAHCHDDTGSLVCDARGGELLDHARFTSHVTTGLFVAGLALGTVAVVLELRAKRAERAEHATVTTAWASPSGLGVVIGGVW